MRSVPFDANIDIRESIDYKEVMKQYNLGPNGGILTSLNLFATKVDQILGILERRCGISPPETSTTSTEEQPQQPSPAQQPPQQAQPAQQPNPPITHILLDTPGQIEVFVWSASGSILTSSLASSFPTVLAYIIDTPRTTSTSTFMSNMLYACSILYKTKLPMVLVFNKTDVQDAEFVKEWMTDFEAFQAALKREEEGLPAVSNLHPTAGFATAEDDGVGAGGAGGAFGANLGGSGYMSSLLNSMSLVLEEFYRTLSVCAVSSMTGAGIPEFFEAVEEKRVEFERDYRPELERRRKEKVREEAGRRERELGRLMGDLNVEVGGQGRGMMGGQGGPGGRPKKPEPEVISDLEDEDEEDDDNDYGLGEQPEADYIEPDEEERDDDENGEGNDGLTERYKRAMAEQEEEAGPNPDDFSFARYIRNSQR